MVRLNEELAGRMRAHAAETFPNECCGALLGREDANGREVVEVLPLVNRRDDSPRNRFAITPDDFRAAERAAKERGLALVGWYHSHPDHAARPSDYDRQHAWPWYTYIIVGVERGEPKLMTSWRLADDRAWFVPEEIQTAEARATA